MGILAGLKVVSEVVGVVKLFTKKKVSAVTQGGGKVYAVDHGTNKVVREFSMKRTVSSVGVSLASAGVMYGVATGKIDAETAQFLLEALNTMGEAVDSAPMDQPSE